MFEVNLINPSGIQGPGEHRVISYRDRIPVRDLPDPAEQLSAQLKSTSISWKRSIIYYAVILILLLSGWFLYRFEKDKLTGDSLTQTSLSEVQFFTILNSMYELRSTDVYLELAEHSRTGSSITFISDRQNLLNELAHKIESKFHHDGWIGGNLTNGGRLLYQWKTTFSERPIQTVFVSKNIIIEILKNNGLTWTDRENSLSAIVPVELTEDILEQLDSLNHTLGITFRLAPVDEQNGIRRYLVVFDYLFE